MSVLSDPMDDAFRTRAVWYDGHSAIRHEGEAVWTGGDRLQLLGADTLGAMDVDISDLVYGEERAEEIVYSRTSVPDFRLILPADMPARLARRMPERQAYGAWVDRLGFGKATAIFAAVSVAAVALFMTAPEWLGPRVPQSWERNLGDALVGDLGNRVCNTPQSDAALAKLLDAVDPADEKVRAGIANIDMVNAVALPGGQVLLFDGLVQEAETPEELAGVLGHEVGHVRERHVMTAILRQFGLSILLSGANSSVGETAFGLASMGYSRDAEREADQYARDRMAESQVSPLGAARFFERIGGDAEESEQNAVIGWVSSHPDPIERARAYRAAAEGGTFRPVLSDAEFQALKGACAGDPDVEEFDIF